MDRLEGYAGWPTAGSLGHSTVTDGRHRWPDQLVASGRKRGAGIVIAAGDQAKDWIGRGVDMIGDGMYADLTKIRTRGGLPLPDGVTATQGAPLTFNPSAKRPVRSSSLIRL